MTAAAALLLLALGPGGPPPAEIAPGYPVPLPWPECFTTPCSGARLVDLEIEGIEGEGGGVEGRLAARWRLGDAGFLGLGRAAGDRWRLTWGGARWDLAWSDEPSRTGLEVERRGRRLRLTAAGSERSDTPGEDARRGISVELGLRLGAALEIAVSADRERDEAPLPGVAFHPVETVGGALVFRPSVRFEADGSWTRSEGLTSGGERVVAERGEIAVLRARPRWEIDGTLAWERRSGRVASREAALDAEARVRVGRFVVVHGGGGYREELDLGSLGSGARAGVAVYARPFVFPRTGAAGERTLELVRAAWEAGLNELPRHDLEGRRRLRERLDLSRLSPALEPLIAGLYRSQIAERNVPLAGFETALERNELLGEEVRRLRLFAGLPWPPLRPWHPSTERVEFLTLAYERTERDVTRGFTTRGHRLELIAALHRELDLRLAWDDPAATGLDLALGRSRPGRLHVSLRYRRGI